MADIPELYRLNYPIETPEAQAFWSSRHKANRAKAIMAFSLDLDNANDNYRRWNYPRQFRKRALLNFCMYVNQPDMKGIPLSPLDSPWWEEMPYRTDSACDGGGGDVPVTGVTISPKTFSLSVGDTKQLSATVAPSNATNKSVTYSTSDATIATVSSSGLVTALKTGSVTITVTTVDGGKTDTSVVTISAAVSAAPVITSQPQNTSIKVGQTFSMSVVATGTGTLTYQWQEKQATGSWNSITHKEPSWTSAPAAAAATRTFRVIVTNTESGKTPTSVTSNEAVVTITANVNITSMASASDLMGVYDTTVDVKNVPLPYHVEPANATVASVKYSMSGDDVTVRGITVDENTGVITVPAKQVDGTEQTGDNFSVTVTVTDASGKSFSDTSAYHVYGISRYVIEGVGSQVVTVGQDYEFQYSYVDRWGYTFGNEAGSPVHNEATIGFATVDITTEDPTVLSVKSVNGFKVIVHGEKDGGTRVVTKINYGGASGEDSTYVSVNDPALHATS